MWITYAVPAVLIAAIVGCSGGRKELPVAESPGDTAKVFIFAESPLMNIDSKMMSDELAKIQVPGEIPRIDSATAMQAVYQLLTDSLLSTDALRFDLKTESPSLYKQYLDLLNDRVMRTMYIDLVVDSVSVSDSLIQATYEAEKESFHVPDRYRARHIVISGDDLRYSTDSATYKDMTDEQLDSAAHARIAELHQRAVEGDDFDTLAMLYSQDQNTASKGGDLGYFELAQMVPPFDSAVEHTPIGQVSGPVKTKYGWHILRVDDFSPAHDKPLDSVYDQINNDLRQKDMIERSRKFLDSLRNAMVLVFDTANVMMADSLHADGDVMALINPQDTINGNDTIYYSEYRQQETTYRRFYKKDGALALEDKVEILKGTSTQKLLREAARILGYHQAVATGDWSLNKLKQYSRSVLWQSLKDDGYDPSDEEMRAYYDAHIDQYQVERPVTVQHIVFQDSALAEYVRDLLLSGVDFMEMVDKYYPGDPDIRRAAANLGAIGPNDMPEAFYRAALYTPVGSISHAVKTQYGYHLIKVLDRSYSMDFEQAKSKIRPILLRQHERKILRDFVQTRLGVLPTIHYDKVSELHFPVPNMTNSSPLPPGTPHSP